MAKRTAILIGNETFKAEAGLLPLDGPLNDITALSRILADSKLGCFEVSECRNKSSYDIRRKLEGTLKRAVPGDLVLIHYSGHGVLDRNLELCLATADTEEEALYATSIRGREVRELVERSDCNQVILLLDCCYSGAVGRGFRGSAEGEIKVISSARGFITMTASTRMQAARETQRSSDGVVMGRFTTAIVDGIESGMADKDHKGEIRVSDLRRHIERTVTGQTPQFFDHEASGDPLISYSPATLRQSVDGDVFSDLQSNNWHRRSGAVAALALIIQNGPFEARNQALQAISLQMQDEPDPIVREAMASVIGLQRPVSPPPELEAPPVGPPLRENPPGERKLFNRIKKMGFVAGLMSAAVAVYFFVLPITPDPPPPPIVPQPAPAVSEPASTPSTLPPVALPTVRIIGFTRQSGPTASQLDQLRSKLSSSTAFKYQVTVEPARANLDLTGDVLFVDKKDGSRQQTLEILEAAAASGITIRSIQESAQVRSTFQIGTYPSEQASKTFFSSKPVLSINVLKGLNGPAFWKYGYNGTALCYAGPGTALPCSIGENGRPVQN